MNEVFRIIGAVSNIIAAVNLLCELILICIMSIEITSGALKYLLKDGPSAEIEWNKLVVKTNILKGDFTREFFKDILKAIQLLLIPSTTLRVVAAICQGIFTYRNELCQFICEHPYLVAGGVVAILAAVYYCREITAVFIARLFR